MIEWNNTRLEIRTLAPLYCNERCMRIWTSDNLLFISKIALLAFELCVSLSYSLKTGPSLLGLTSQAFPKILDVTISWGTLL